MDIDRARKATGKALPRIAILFVILLAFPIDYRVTRVLTVLGVLGLWAGTLFLWWRLRRVRVPLLGLLGLAVAVLARPGRPAAPSALRADYGMALRLYRHARYVRGGESPLGIDCSGLVRKGLVWGQIMNGLRTANGTPIRNGISLADPDVRRVVSVTVPTENPWFSVPVSLVRWTALDDVEPEHPASADGVPR